MRIRAGTPRFGAEIDDRVMPAEAGLVERAVSLDKGCFPGQEPIARLHYRGHANRALRIVEVETTEPPALRRRDLARRQGGRAHHVGSAHERQGARARVRPRRGSRRRRARRGRRSRASTLGRPAPVAQGIERCPAEAEVARSNRAGRISRRESRHRCAVTCDSRRRKSIVSDCVVCGGGASPPPRRLQVDCDLVVRDALLRSAWRGASPLRHAPVSRSKRQLWKTQTSVGPRISPSLSGLPSCGQRFSNAWMRPSTRKSTTSRPSSVTTARSLPSRTDRGTRCVLPTRLD